jgi:hypothetical protein
VSGSTAQAIRRLTVRLRVVRPNGRIVYQRTVTQRRIKAGVFAVPFEKSFADLTLREGRYSLDALVTADRLAPLELHNTLFLVKASRPTLPVVLVPRFRYAPSLDSDGRFVTDPATFVTTRDEVTALTGILSRMPDVRLCLAMPPLQLDEWRRIVAGYQTVGPTGTRTVPKGAPVTASYAAALSGLQTALRGGRLQLVDVPFADPDLAGLASIDALSDLHDHYARSNSTYLASLGATPSPTTSVYDDVVTPDAAKQLAEERLSYVLLQPASLASKDPTPPAGVYRLQGTTVQGVVVDREAQRMLETPATRPEELLDHLFERLTSDEASAPVVVPVRFGPGASADTTAFEAMLRELGRSGWVSFEGLSSISRAEPSGTLALDVKARAGRAAPAGYWEEVSAGRVPAQAFVDAVSERDPDASAALYASLVSESRSWAGADDSWSLAERGRAFAALARRRSEAVLSKVSVSTSNVTLSGTAGKVPLSVKNESGKTLEVYVIARALHATFPQGPRVKVTLRPADNYVTIPIDLGRGNIYDRVTVSVVAGDVRLASTRLEVRASYLDRLALIAMVVAVLAGLLFYIRRKVRRAEADI